MDAVDEYAADGTESDLSDDDDDEYDIYGRGEGGGDGTQGGAARDSKVEVSSVQVSVRVRPLNAAELAAEAASEDITCITTYPEDPNRITVKSNKRLVEDHHFGFDNVFYIGAPQEEVLSSCVSSVVSGF